MEKVRQTSYVKAVYKPIVSVGLDHQLICPVWENALIPKSVASPSLVSEHGEQNAPHGIFDDLVRLSGRIFYL